MTIMENHPGISRFAAASVFLLIFLAGLFCYKDYGISVDEPIQRKHSLVNYKYVNSCLGREIGRLKKQKSLEDYDNRYYGVFLQFPLAMIEDINSFSMQKRDIFLLRHLYTFLICFIGYVFFYFAIRKIFNSDYLAILGVVLIFLYPRFFAHQFYNIKDMFFVAMFMISLWATVMFVENRDKIKWAVTLGAISAVATNVRILGLIFPILALGYLLIDHALNKNIIRQKTDVPRGNPVMLLKTGSILIASYLAAFIIVTPASWKNPLRHLFETFVMFSNFEKWNGTQIFAGEVITGKVPVHYIPVWMGITIPPLYLIFALLSLFIFGARIIRQKNRLACIFGEYKYITLSLALLFLPWLAITLKNATIYNGWRHVFFLFVPIVVLILYSVKTISDRFNSKPVVLSLIGIFTVQLLIQCFWIARNHPYEYVYFNAIGERFPGRFDRDYWRVANYDAVQYILKNDKRDLIELSDYLAIRITAGNFLGDADHDRLKLVPAGEYLIESYRYINGNTVEHEGYEEIRSIRIDGINISTIFRKVQ
ncbi:MAG TPA: glycosyltransferase family 39 protein [Spirochaetota bacterium]|nr:glycosyltransferase family 39 protein [Spirochaetota bacterium]HRZ29101.1 glycosyltransferase family 39 protein [Spirochaetota bacterium]HSA13408.1 glycosyltransferase family 39 protein [Spirochaetota bacterium]